MVGVYFLQLMALALLLVKTFPYALLLLPLLVLTACFHVVVGKLFRRPWALMNAKEAAVLDARDHVSGRAAAPLLSVCARVRVRARVSGSLPAALLAASPPPLLCA